MTVASIRLASCAGALSIAVAAHADFRAALADYNAGRYLAAHEQFQRLAELGPCIHKTKQPRIASGLFETSLCLFDQ